MKQSVSIIAEENGPCQCYAEEMQRVSKHWAAGLMQGCRAIRACCGTWTAPRHQQMSPTDAPSVHTDDADVRPRASPPMHASHRPTDAPRSMASLNQGTARKGLSRSFHAASTPGFVPADLMRGLHACHEPGSPGTAQETFRAGAGIGEQGSIPFHMPHGCPSVPGFIKSARTGSLPGAFALDER